MIFFYSCIVVISIILTKLCITINVMDVPTPMRSSHDQPTPTSGGIGFIAACCGALLYQTTRTNWSLNDPRLIIIMTGLVLALLGYLDDRKELNYKLRLAVQLIICGFVVTYFLGWDTTAKHIIVLGTLTIFFSGFVNAINFCDGLNGLLASGTIIVCGYMAFTNSLFATYMLPLAFALIGFAVFNYRGKIFMGDVGSSFIGFFIPAILLLDPKNLYANILTMGHLYFIYLFDISTVIFMKLKNREDVFTPHRDFHFHKLNKLGLSHIAVTVIYSLFTIVQVLILICMGDNVTDNWVYIYGMDFFLYVGLFRVIRNLDKKFMTLKTD